MFQSNHRKTSTILARVWQEIIQRFQSNHSAANYFVYVVHKVGSLSFQSNHREASTLFPVMLLSGSVCGRDARSKVYIINVALRAFNPRVCG